MDFIFRAAEAFLKKHKRLQRYRRVFAFLAAVVVFATTYELILPAITMDRRRAAETPGVEVGVAAEGFEDTEEILEAEETVEEQNTEDETVDSTTSGETASDKTEETDSIDAPDASNASDHTSEGSNEEVSDIVETDSAGEAASDSDGSLMEGESNEETTENGSGSEASDTVSDAAIESEGIGSGNQTAASAENAVGTGEEILSTEEILTDPVQLTFEAPDRSYLITATFDETAALPADVSLNAVEILPDTQYRDAEDNLLYADYGEYYEKTVDTLEKAGRLADTYVSSARFFDITFTGADGQPLEPAAPVNIAVKYNTEVPSAKDTDETLAVHFDDVKIEDRKDADLPEIGKAEVIETENQVKKDKIEEITFAAQKFSVYGLAATETLETKVLTANGDTYEICVSYNQKAEIPEGAKLEAYELMLGTDEYEECVAKSANTDENGQTASRFFNISIIVDGAEYEPKAPVDVRITLKDTSPEEVAADKDITHFTNAGEVESIPQEVEGSSEGGAEVSFQMDSFSTVEVPLLGAGSTPTYTISVGGTKEITGTESNSANSWSSSDETVATVSNSSTNTATVTGVNAGTATITHTYYVKKKTATEKFTINVEAASGEITETADASDGNVTVSVKRTGSTKKLEGSTLVVEKLTSGADFEEYAQALTDNGGDVSALKGMYHIYLIDSNGDEVSVSNANMEVTITDPDLAGLNNVNVGHFKKGNSGLIESKGFTNEETTVFKKCAVSENGITIKIQSFSVFTVSDSSDVDTSTETQDGVQLNYTSGTLSASEINNYNNSGKNSYAIGTVGAYQSVNGANIVKYVEPTNIEDVFKVTVAVERSVTDTDLNEILAAMPAYIINENKNKVDSAVGTILEPKEYQNGDCYALSDTTAARALAAQGPEAFSTNDYFRTTYSYTIEEDGRMIQHTIGPIKMYRAYGKDSGMNHGIIGILPNGKWIVIDTNNFKWSDHGSHSVALSSSQYEDLVDAATGKVTVDGVTDHLDTDRFIYLGSSIDDFENTSTVSSTANPTVSLSNTTASYSNGTITWSGNGFPDMEVNTAATMTYYVRLRTSKLLEASSDINGMTSSDGEPVTGSGMAYELASSNTMANVTVQQAVAGVGTITSNTTTTQISATQPSVKGLLYYIKLLKQDNSENNLSGAVFEVYQGNATSGTSVATITTGSDGIGISSPGLPWGNYTLVETEAPTGYELPDNPVIGTYELAYLAYGTGWTHDQINPDKMGEDISETAVTNTTITLNLALKKVGSDGIDLTGVEFEVTKAKPDGTTSTLPTMYLGEGTLMMDWGSTYTIHEVEAPDGYEIADDLIVRIDKQIVDGEQTVGVSINGTFYSATKTSTNGVYEYSLAIIDPLNAVPVRVIKTIAGVDTDTLSGCIFTVTGPDGFSDSTWESLTDGIMYDAGLSTGTYTLREISAPAGYPVPETATALIKVDPADATPVKYSQTNCDGNEEKTAGLLDPTKEVSEDNPYVVYVTNYPARELPSSGGSGTFIYKIGAMALIALALITSYTLRQRERRYKN